MPAKKKQTLAELQQQIGELTEALQRERADAANVRRRAEEERVKLAGFYKATVVRDLLPALDNLERSLMHIPKDIAEHDYVKGIQGVVKQFEKVFSDMGVKRIKTIGEHFDPNLHEALSIDDGDGHDEIVSEELQPGYMLGEDVIRHAMVKVKRK